MFLAKSVAVFFFGAADLFDSIYNATECKQNLVTVFKVKTCEMCNVIEAWVATI